MNTLWDALPKARATDPQTSHDAAKRATRTVSKSHRAVLDVMIDGKPRTDEEIVADAKSLGWTCITPQRLRGARNELYKAGALRLTGNTRTTSTGGKTREWVFA